MRLHPTPATISTMVEARWQALARSQGGLITRGQLNALGIDRWAVRNNLVAGRWLERAPTVIGTTTGALTRIETMWLAVLHGGPRALLAGLSAAELFGLTGWHRDAVTVLVPYGNDVRDLPGITYIRTRRSLHAMRSRSREMPACRVEPAVLLWAATQRSPRTAQGVLAAVVQQRLTTPEALGDWLARLRPLPRAQLFRTTIGELAGGAQSLAEIDIGRMCKRHGISLPRRQVKRRDSDGRIRYTDCEWPLPGGGTAVLEVDGLFHIDIEQWEDDLARQRALSAPGRIIVRCTARELRDDDATVARDLLNLGVPRAA